MRDYEILYIVRPDLDEEQLSGAVSKVNTLIENLGGVAERTNVWGKRRLAYEVDHLREGHYVLTDFQIDPPRVPEMESSLKISDTVFRHLIVRKPDRVAAVVAAAAPPDLVAEPEPEQPEAETEAALPAATAVEEE